MTIGTLFSKLQRCNRLTCRPRINRGSVNCVAARSDLVTATRIVGRQDFRSCRPEQPVPGLSRWWPGKLACASHLQIGVSRPPSVVTFGDRRRGNAEHWHKFCIARGSWQGQVDCHDALHMTATALSTPAAGRRHRDDGWPSRACFTDTGRDPTTCCGSRGVYVEASARTEVVFKLR